MLTFFTKILLTLILFWGVYIVCCHKKKSEELGIIRIDRFYWSASSCAMDNQFSGYLAKLFFPLYSIMLYTIRLFWGESKQMPSKKIYRKKLFLLRIILTSKLYFFELGQLPWIPSRDIIKTCLGSESFVVVIQCSILVYKQFCLYILSSMKLKESI